MNQYEHQRSRSSIDLGPRSNFFSLETARPIEAKFHVDPVQKWFKSQDQDGRHTRIG